jgi:hypothetical protein
MNVADTFLRNIGSHRAIRRYNPEHGTIQDINRILK